MAELDGTDDYFDSRDVLARIDELEEEYAGEDPEGNFVNIAGMDEDEREEYAALLELREEAEPYIADWNHGETFISEDHFEDYARELAEDCGYITDEVTWPLNRIDWEAAAEDLKIDYTSFEFRGTTYWAR